MNNQTKKFLVLFSVFIGPLIFYVLISSGINNFSRLPVVTENVMNVSVIDSTKTFKEKISLVCFLGDDVESVKGGFFNLNQKIYKPFYGFDDFQIIVFYPKEKEESVQKLKRELGAFTDMGKWKFVAASLEDTHRIFKSFQTTETLGENGFSAKSFIVDRDLNLRGRLLDKETQEAALFGYNMQSVAELNNKMKDDIKIVLAEYRLALKRNKNKRKI